jgi:hypothetical protein
MKFLKHTVWSLIVASMMGACMGFDEINVDPDKTNRPTPGMLATQVLFSMMDSRSNSSEGFANHCMLSKHLACGEKIRDYAYNRIGRTSFGAYTSLIEAEKMVECAAEVEKPAYRALAHFVRAYNLFYLTMRVGDIPYSEALGGEKGNFTPRYDTQKDVIAGVLDELDEAYELFSQASDFAGDFVFGGKPDKWMRTVNAFELKVLMYCAAKDAEIDAAARFAQVFGRGKLLASNADNFQLVYSSRPDQMYPFNQYPKFSMYMLVSSTLVEMLKEHEDRRLFYYAEPAQTLLSAGEDAYEAYEGVDPVAESSEIVNAYMRGSCSKLNNRYLETEAGEPFIRIGYAEQQFILAEAVLRKWITGEGAESYYRSGIRAAMEFTAANTPVKYRHGVKIDDAYIASYLEGPQVKFGASAAENLNRIYKQKYMLYFLQHEWDAFFECRRTGVPELPVNPSTNMNTDPSKMPVRWMYPQTEYDRNNANVMEAIARQYDGLDNENCVMWLLK